MADDLNYTLGLDSSGFEKAVKESLSVVKGLGQGIAGLGKSMGVEFNKGRAAGAAFREQIDRAAGAARNLGNAIGNIGGRAASALGSLGALAGKITAIGGLIGGALGGIGVASAIKLAGGVEQAEVAFQNLLGTAELGKEAVERLAALEAATPFDIEELNNAGRSVAIATGTVDGMIEKLKVLGNVAAAQNVPIGELALAYQKAATAGGIVQAEEINMIGDRGIPIIEELAKVMGVAQGSVRKLASEGKVSFADFDKALANLGGPAGKFGQAMEQQSKTTLGLFSSLGSAFKALLIEFGRPVADGLKPVLEGAIDLATALRPLLRDLGEAVGGFIKRFAEVAGGAGGAAEGLKAAFREAVETFGEYMDVVWASAKVAIVAMGKALYDAFVPVINFVSLKLEIAAKNFAATFSRNIGTLMAELPKQIVGDAPKNLFLGANELEYEALQLDQFAVPEAIAKMKKGIDAAMIGLAQGIGDSTAKLKAGIAEVSARRNPFIAPTSPAPAVAPPKPAVAITPLSTPPVKSQIEKALESVESQKSESLDAKIAALRDAEQKLKDLGGATLFGGGRDASEEYNQIEKARKGIEDKLQAALKEQAVKAKAVGLAREEFDAELEVLTLRAKGKNDAAEAAQRELDTRRLAVRLQADLAIGEAEALKLAKAKIDLEKQGNAEKARGGRIRGADQAGIRGFEGIQKFEGRLAERFQFARLPGGLQNAAAAQVQAAKAPAGPKPPPDPVPTLKQLVEIVATLRDGLGKLAAV